MSLEQTIKQHRRCRRYEKIIRQLRLRIFDYEDAGKGEKADRILRKAKKICKPQWDREYRSRETARTLNYMM